MTVTYVKDYINPDYLKLTPEQLEKDVQEELEKYKELKEWPYPHDCMFEAEE